MQSAGPKGVFGEAFANMPSPRMLSAFCPHLRCPVAIDNKTWVSFFFINFIPSQSRPGVVSLA